MASPIRLYAAHQQALLVAAGPLIMPICWCMASDMMSFPARRSSAEVANDDKGRDREDGDDKDFLERKPRQSATDLLASH